MSRPPVLSVRGERLSASELERVVAALGPGALLIFPTDTLYGLGGRARDAEAARRVRTAKGRPDAQPLPVVAADPEQVDGLCPGWRVHGAGLAAAFWPGPLTLVLPAAEQLPAELTSGGGTLAVRVPGRELTRQLCRALGPLVATSANRSGEPAPATCQAALAGVGVAAALAVDAGVCDSPPSTIVAPGPAGPRLLREGAIAWEAVRRALA